jgi:hypothetical protein
MNFIKVGNQYVNLEQARYAERTADKFVIIFADNWDCEHDTGTIDKVEFYGEEADAVEKFFSRFSADVKPLAEPLTSQRKNYVQQAPITKESL